MKLRTLTIDPNNPKSIAEAISELLQVVNSKLDIGDPIDPRDDASVLLAGVGFHNGTPSNVVGSWVELEFEALDTATTATHNLGIPVVNSEVNVRWAVMGVRHSGVGATVASTLSVNYEDGDVVGENAIQLRAYCTSGRTVNAANPVRVSLRFYPATRWPN